MSCKRVNKAILYLGEYWTFLFLRDSRIGDECDPVKQMEHEAVELSNAAFMTEQILENDSPDAQICKESMRSGELKCFETP